MIFNAYQPAHAECIMTWGSKITSPRRTDWNLEPQPRSQGPKTIFTGEIYPRLPGVGKSQVPKTDGFPEAKSRAVLCRKIRTDWNILELGGTRWMFLNVSV